MALITRYFSTTAAGTGDGTSWANRAALFIGGNWSSIITSFIWGTNKLECRIGPGNYTCSQQLASSILDPSFSGSILVINGCNADGSLWIPPKWSSAQPAFWENELPCINYTLDSQAVTINCIIRGLKIKRENSAHVIGGIFNLVTCDWVIVEYHPNVSTSGIIISGALGATYSNTVIKSYSLGYSRMFQMNGTNCINFIFNCRAENIVTPTAGNRIAFETNRTISGSASNYFVNCTVVNGFIGFSCGISTRMVVTNATVITTSIGVVSTVTTPALVNANMQCNNSFIVSPTGVKEGIGGTRFGSISDNRIRATTPLDINSDQPLWNKYTEPGLDADEFVDAPNGDYRIKNTSIYWGKGIGAGDEPSSGGGYYNPFRQPTRIG